MSSDAYSKDSSMSLAKCARWLPMLVAFLVGAFLGPILGIASPGTDIPVVRDFAVDKVRAPGLQPQLSSNSSRTRSAITAVADPKLRSVAPKVDVATVVPKLDVRTMAPKVDVTSQCDIAHIDLKLDPRFTERAQELRQEFGNRTYPTFEELYQLVVNRPYRNETSIWNTFPNMYGLKAANFHFPFSNLHKPHIDKVLSLIGRRVKLAVEVGSFHGHSAIWQAFALDQAGYKETPLLCIDPWTGALGMLLNRDDWDKKLTPGEIADGRSTSYWQFMLNIRSQIQSGTIGAKHIIPLAVTSIVGAKFLMALEFQPDMIFLDSAHEKDETFMELTLFYNVLAPGGVLFGDDLSWAGVNNDVRRFIKKHNLELLTEGVIWMIQKPSHK